MSKIDKIGKINRGFSLLEMIVYIAILVLLLGVIMGITISVVHSHKAIKTSKSLENSAMISFERITREIRQADSINAVSSIFDSSPGKLVLTGIDDLGNSRTVEFYLESDAILLKENGVGLGQLSQPEAKVNSLIFRLYSSPLSNGVRAEMAIESGTSTYYKSKTFYSSATLR